MAGICVTDAHMKRDIDFLAVSRERIPFHEMVTYRFSLTDIKEALNTTADWRSAKSVIVP